MKITIIGHLTRDVFHLPDDGSGKENTIKSRGGIFYSIATLASICAQEDKIVPVCGVGENDYDDVIECCQRYGNVETKGMFKVKGGINEVHYYCAADGGRTECSKDIAAPIPFSRIKPYLEADGVLIGMASGFDVTLETLDYIRMQVREESTPIHFGFGSLTLGIDKDHARFRRPLTDWRRWCFMVNSVQLSEEEAASLTAERYDEPTLSNHLLPLMVNALIITRGERGVTVVRQERKKLIREDIPGVGLGDRISTTGSGKVFGAAFFYEYLRTKDYLRAAAYGNRAAAVKSSFYGSERLDTLSQQLRTEVPSQ